jgi:DNA polymerase (family 10)
VDVPAVIQACAESGTFLELNAHPYRLDISDLVCREAKEAGVKVVLGTDAHSDAHYSLMQYGVFTARRGWLEKKDVINCLPLEKLRKALKSHG